MLDPTFGMDYFDCDEEDFIILANRTMHQLKAKDVTNLLLSPIANSTLLCFDFEGGNGMTSEYGWAWLHSDEVRDKVPGERGENCWQYIRAQHHLNVNFWNSKGSRFTDGNPHGFWSKYGRTKRYYPASGAQPLSGFC